VLAVLDGDPGGDGLEEGLADGGTGPDGGAVAPGDLADGEVALGLEGAFEARVDHLDAAEPLDVGDAEPAWGDEAERGAVGGGEWLAVHLVAEEVGGIGGLGPGHAPGEGRLGLELAHLVAEAADVLDGLLALIGAVEDDLDAIGLAAGLLEHGGEGGACPAGVADGAGEEGEAVVPGALEGEDDLLSRERLDRGEVVGGGAGDVSGDLELPLRRVDVGDAVVSDAEELLGGGDPRVGGLGFPVELVEAGEWRRWGGGLVEEGDGGLAGSAPGEERGLEEGDPEEGAVGLDEGVTA
jgi:hypothetical protein